MESKPLTESVFTLSSGMEITYNRHGGFKLRRPIASQVGLFFINPNEVDEFLKAIQFAIEIRYGKKE